jgi:hypothetical protein
MMRLPREEIRPIPNPSLSPPQRQRQQANKLPTTTKKDSYDPLADSKSSLFTSSPSSDAHLTTRDSRRLSFRNRAQLEKELNLFSAYVESTMGEECNLEEEQEESEVTPKSSPKSKMPSSKKRSSATTMFMSKSKNKNKNTAAANKGTVATPSPKDKTPKEKKKVKFLSSVMVRKTLHLNNYTDDEFDSCFYNRQELLEIKRELAALCILMEERDLVDSVRFGSSFVISKKKLRGFTESYEQEDDGNESMEICMRGLESQTPSGCRQRALNRRTALEIVLEEQEQFRKTGVKDNNASSWDYVAPSYSRFTRAFQKLAEEIGRLDFQEGMMVP